MFSNMRLLRVGVSGLEARRPDQAPMPVAAIVTAANTIFFMSYGFVVYIKVTLLSSRRTEVAAAAAFHRNKYRHIG